MKENFPKLRYVMFGNYTVFEFVSFEGGCLKITSLSGLVMSLNLMIAQFL